MAGTRRRGWCGGPQNMVKRQQSAEFHEMFELQAAVENFLCVQNQCYGYEKHSPRSGKSSARRIMFIRRTKLKIWLDLLSFIIIPPLWRVLE